MKIISLYVSHIVGSNLMQLESSLSDGIPCCQNPEMLSMKVKVQL